MADPGFPRGGGANPEGGGGNLFLWSIFPKNYMKMIKIGPRGGAVLVSPPPDPPMNPSSIKAGDAPFFTGC